MLGSGVLCLALLPCQHVGSVVTGSKKGGSKLCSSFSHRALRAQRGTTASRVCWGHWCEAARVAASVTMLETRRWSCRTLCSTHCPGCRGVAGAALLAPSPTRHPTAEAPVQQQLLCSVCWSPNRGCGWSRGLVSVTEIAAWGRAWGTGGVRVQRCVLWPLGDAWTDSRQLVGIGVAIRRVV